MFAAACLRSVRPSSTAHPSLLLLLLAFLALRYVALPQSALRSTTPVVTHQMDNHRRPQRVRWLIGDTVQRFRNTSTKQTLLRCLKHPFRHTSDNDRESPEYITMADQEEDYSALPLQDRFAHKVRRRVKILLAESATLTPVNDRSGKLESPDTKMPRSSSLYHLTSRIRVSAHS